MQNTGFFKSKIRYADCRIYGCPGRAGKYMAGKPSNGDAKKARSIANVWIVLASVVSILFAVIGFVMVFIDPEPRYLNGSMYLVSAAAFAAAICVLVKTKSANQNDERLNMFFMQGFVLQILGIGPLFSGEWVVAKIAGVAIWGAGFVISVIWMAKALSRKG